MGWEAHDPDKGKGPDLKDLRKKLGISTQEEAPPLQAIPHKDLVAKYPLFKDSVGFQRGTIYHPCGANDISPSVAFPGSRVIYADIEDGFMRVVRQAGYEAYAVDVLTFHPGPVDVLILLNPQIKPNIPASFVKENGYVLCNDYHNTATILRQNGYKPLAIIRMTKKGLLYDTENPGEYWTEIETDEEFQNAMAKL